MAQEQESSAETGIARSGAGRRGIRSGRQGHTDRHGQADQGRQKLAVGDPGRAIQGRDVARPERAEHASLASRQGQPERGKRARQGAPFGTRRAGVAPCHHQEER